MNFEWALTLLKEGRKVCREGWTMGNTRLEIRGDGESQGIYICSRDHPKYYMHKVSLDQRDILAEDWQEWTQ